MARNRHLEDRTESPDYDNSEQVWQHNAWDDLEWTSEMTSQAEDIVASHHILRDTKDSGSFSNVFEEHTQWDAFYTRHDRWFFKDRKWLVTEFPELITCFQEHQLNDEKNNLSQFTVLELGCGAGNTVYPLLRLYREEQKKMARKQENFLCEQGSDKGEGDAESLLSAFPLFKIHACDFSEQACQLVREHRDYDANLINVFQHDLADCSPEAISEFHSRIAPGSVDLVIAIFVLSALMPTQLEHVLRLKIEPLCKGLVGINSSSHFLFRDYGRLDLNQLRMSPSRFLCIPDTYRRGDGTIVHYFDEPEIEKLFSLWTCIDLHTDRRLIVNRKRRLLMRRIWVQGRFKLKLK